MDVEDGTRVPPGHYELGGRFFPNRTWYKDSGMRKLYFYVFVLLMTSATNGYDGSMMNALQSLSWWQNYFDHPSGSILGLFSAIMSVGSIVALPIVPYIPDLFGRRWGIIIGSLIMILGVGLQTGAPNFHMFIAARFLLGFGNAIATGSAPLLITELAHVQHRPIVSTMYNTFYYVGAVTAAWATYGTLKIDNDWSWRLPSLLQCVFSVFQFTFIWFVPESPRYYIAKEKHEKALNVLAKYHANGDENDEVVQLEYLEIQNAIAMDRSVNNDWHAWLELFQTKGNRKRLIILVSAGFFSQWSGNGLVSYYINLILTNIGMTNANTQLIVNGCLTTFGGLVAFNMSFFVERIGRRMLFLVATGGMVICFTVWTILSARYNIAGDAGVGKGVVVMIFVFMFFYNISWSGLLISYTCEILPFRIRAKGMTIVFLCVDGALFFNQYVNPVALDNLGWKYYIFYCVWLVFEFLVVYFFYVETRKTPLEEITKFFDGEDAAADILDMSGIQKADKVELEHLDAVSTR
ncbi:lactose permease [Dipodascopsis tothii]|uniref:lactose permease n=1 Tax=Dipodascopsis tothii TaxID=44089 RepID=UPI0034CE19F6